MPGTDGPNAAGVKIGGVTPILRVRSLQASLDYYVGVLGFKVNWQADTTMASVSRDRASIMLCEGDQGNPGTWLWFGVNDADVLCEEYTEAGATIGLPPTNYPWAYTSTCRTPTGTSCVSAPIPKRADPSPHGSLGVASRGNEHKLFTNLYQSLVRRP